MDFTKIFYPEVKFGGFTDLDGAVIFHTRVHSLLKPSFIVCDIGCGRGMHVDDQISTKRELRIYKGKCKKVIGIDVDNRASENPFIDEFHRIEGDYFPLEDELIDLALSVGVLEHVENPDLFFSECNRIIKPGGYLCMTTVNTLNYLAIFSRLIPNRLHAAVLKVAQPGRKDADIFNTYYRCNTIWKIRAILDKFNFEHCVYGYEAEPSYHQFSLLFYVFGFLHQRFSPKFLKPAIFAFARKLGKT